MPELGEVVLVELPELLDHRRVIGSRAVHVERPDGLDDQVTDSLGKQGEHRELGRRDPHRLVVVVG